MDVARDVFLANFHINAINTIPEYIKFRNVSGRFILGNSQPPSKTLEIYERQFIEVCKSIGEIIVYTSAKRDYARKICAALYIQPKELLTRIDCINTYGVYIKKVRGEWYRVFKEILIVDDSPNVWDYDKRRKISFIVPHQFMGEGDDVELKKIIEDI